MCFVFTGACNFRLKHPLHGGAASALRQSQSKSSRLHSSRSRRQGSVGRSVPETPRQSERHCEGNVHVWFLGWWTLTEPPNNLPPTIGIYTVYIYVYIYTPSEPRTLEFVGPKMKTWFWGRFPKKKIKKKHSFYLKNPSFFCPVRWCLQISSQGKTSTNSHWVAPLNSETMNSMGVRFLFNWMGWGTRATHPNIFSWFLNYWEQHMFFFTTGARKDRFF